MMRYLLNILVAFGMCVFLISCRSNPKKNDLTISDESGTISVIDYTVQFGNTTAKPIEDGLKQIIIELKEGASKKENLVGTLTYSFRCEPDGMIRWMAAGESNLNVENQDELKNEFTGNLMKKQVRFPELGEVTMIEAKIKFE